MPSPDSFQPRSLSRRFGLLIAMITFAVLASMAAWAGEAIAVSGGGYQPDQQGCQASDSDWNTPPDETYPGCHNFAVNVESGGTTGGVANPDNTRYASFGIDQSPIDPKSVGTPGLESIGVPGNTGSPHAGCLAVNTDGTNGGPAPAGPPEAGAPAENSTNGCGNNPSGSGFEANFDYYQYYCPVAKMLGFACEDTSYGSNSLTPDTGRGLNLQPIMTNGVLLYLGSDDNLDNGEHDGVGPYTNLVNPNDQGAANGSSDGGALMLLLTPQTATRVPTQSHPEGLANASFGFCADGICVGSTTQQQTVYQGCGAPDANGMAPCNPGTPQNANVYDYAPNGQPGNDPSVNRESPNCNSGDANSTSAAQCGPGGMDAIRSATPANENMEPGVALYSDPDSQRSPAAPSPLWPTPAVYVGTCGVYLGSPATTGTIFKSKPIFLGPLQLTNAAGQLAIDPNPSVC